MAEYRVAVVTGASRGIGAAIAVGLERDGWTVVRTAPEWPLLQPGPDHLVADLADIASHGALVDAIMARHGEIDCLINNAGIASPARGDFLTLAPATFDAVMNVNVRGTIFFTQAVLKAMLGRSSASGSPRSIVFITSASAAMASPERLDYCMSKAALAMFAKGLALRLAGEGVAVFDVRPGIIRTEMTAGVVAHYDQRIADGLVPEGRWGKPEDIAAICVALADGALPFSTGTVIDAGGGLALAKL
jgi:3-oxoacyl-[acyl-carrier protein] reductase